MKKTHSAKTIIGRQLGGSGLSPTGRMRKKSLNPSDDIEMENENMDEINSEDDHSSDSNYENPVQKNQNGKKKKVEHENYDEMSESED